MPTIHYFPAFPCVRSFRLYTCLSVCLFGTLASPETRFCSRYLRYFTERGVLIKSMNKKSLVELDQGSTAIFLSVRKYSKIYFLTCCCAKYFPKSILLLGCEVKSK